MLTLFLFFFNYYSVQFRLQLQIRLWTFHHSHWRHTASSCPTSSTHKRENSFQHFLKLTFTSDLQRPLLSTHIYTPAHQYYRVFPWSVTSFNNALCLVVKTTPAGPQRSRMMSSKSATNTEESFTFMWTRIQHKWVGVLMKSSSGSLYTTQVYDLSVHVYSVMMSQYSRRRKQPRILL